MPVVKGGVWTNIEDEILKASVSKYGLNQWARVSSLLARKTPKQCKARWTEWLDPAIRKIEWSKEEDEKLLHLAKLMPTQWRTIAPIVGRTANQCLERYSRLLDEAEAREHDELALGGPDGGEASAPTGDDVRKLRPGELDPDPESKPARPDTIDMDEDEKEMLSEARARLANTQGKKAKRKARERQLEESRRLAVLQKRRELKNAGINIKIATKKKGTSMDYNADIPFEKAPAAGFYDTLDEQAENEKEKADFDPRKQQLARKRQGDPEDSQDNKRQKQDKGSDEAKKAAARAGALQKMREAEQRSKRRALNLPAPQVSDAELEDIVKMGIAGDRATKAAGEEPGLNSRYTNMVGSTPIRTPMAPPQEDRIANSIRDIQALNNTQSSLLGGENTPLHTGAGSTGFEGAAPTRSQLQTPNPMATPFRQGGLGPGATPLGTPRDNLLLNSSSEVAQKAALRAKLASLPKPKASEFELELPDEQVEDAAPITIDREDQEEIDQRAREAAEAEAAREFARQTLVKQRNLPRPKTIDQASLLARAKAIEDPIRSLIAQEAALLMSHDASAKPLPGTKRSATKSAQINPISDSYTTTAREAIATEAASDPSLQSSYDAYFSFLSQLPTRITLPSSIAYLNSTPSLLPFHAAATNDLLALAEPLNAREKKLKTLLAGYQARQKALKKKLTEGHKTLLEEREKLRAFEDLRIAEEGGLARRLEKLREEVGGVVRREREVQEEYRAVRDELAEVGLAQAGVNGINGHA